MRSTPLIFLLLSTDPCPLRHSLSKEIFDTDHGLWLATKDQELYPAVNSYARESRQLSWYAFIGRILGKAMYEGVLVGVRFASLFLGKWLRKQSYRELPVLSVVPRSLLISIMQWMI